MAGGYRFQSHPDMAPYIERFVLEGQTARLSAAALEALAIVAYKQPVSRAQVARSGVSIRTGSCAPCASGATWGRWAVIRARAKLSFTGRPPCFWSGWASTGSRTFLLGDFVPGPEVMDALEQGLRPPS